MQHMDDVEMCEEVSEVRNRSEHANVLCSGTSKVLKLIISSAASLCYAYVCV
jgi:hypothetical protein